MVRPSGQNAAPPDWLVWWRFRVPKTARLTLEVATTADYLSMLWDGASGCLSSANDAVAQPTRNK